jgi:hypothetical protein
MSVSSVKATGWTTGVRFSGEGNFSLLSLSPGFRQDLRSTQPLSNGVLGRSSPAVKRPGCKDDHSPSSSNEVRNVWNCISTPLQVFMAMCLAKHHTFSWHGTWLSTGKICLLYLYLYLARFSLRAVQTVMNFEFHKRQGIS